MYLPLVVLAYLSSLGLAAPALERTSHPLSARAGPAAGTIITTCSQPNTIALTFDDGP
jgi:hypothetical protein